MHNLHNLERYSDSVDHAMPEYTYQFANAVSACIDNRRP